uniref:Uncharacterized protein n=1 Tax=Caenorhabditis japonica TaxID=281687 RepID=A0A8R1DSK0_CAEJA
MFFSDVGKILFPTETEISSEIILSRNGIGNFFGSETASEPESEISDIGIPTEFRLFGNFRESLIAIEQQNSTAATDQFEPDGNVPISNEEPVGSVHSE